MRSGDSPTPNFVASSVGQRPALPIAVGLSDRVNQHLPLQQRYGDPNRIQGFAQSPGNSIDRELAMLVK